MARAVRLRMYLRRRPETHAHVALGSGESRGNGLDSREATISFLAWRTPAIATGARYKIGKVCVLVLADRRVVHASAGRRSGASHDGRDRSRSGLLSFRKSYGVRDIL